jgi:hypothetical protein
VLRMFGHVLHKGDEFASGHLYSVRKVASRNWGVPTYKTDLAAQMSRKSLFTCEFLQCAKVFWLYL